MKILLTAINAKYIHSNLAVYALRAYAKEFEEHILLREYTINQTKDDILRAIYLERPDVICMSCYIWNVSFVKELVMDLAKVLPDTLFWAGGPEVSFDAERFLLENPAFTGVMLGEGEETFLELVKYYVDKPEADLEKHTAEALPEREETVCMETGLKGLSAIKGIVFRAEKEIRHNECRDVMDLNKVPFVYQNIEPFSNRIIYYESSRGCPFSCSYCLSSVDKKLRFRDLNLVKKELQFFLDQKVKQVKFVDRTFNCRHSHALEVWQYVHEHDNGITNFHFEVSADLLNEEELQLIARMRPGLIQLEIGVQSTNPKTIKAIHRTMNLDRLKENVMRVQSYGNTHQHLDLIAGLPYEDYESFRKSFNDVYALRPQQLQLGFLKVLKGSHMMEMADEYEIVYKNREPYEVLSTKWLPYQDVLKLKRLENMVEVYYNSGQFQNTLRFLEPFFADAFSMYDAIGRYYETGNFLEVSHSRIRRYEILLEFVKTKPEVSVKKTVQKMMLDLYLRENLKSRPAFSPSQKEFEKAIWEFRRQNSIPKTAHIEVFENGSACLFDYENRDALTGNAYVSNVVLN